MNANKNRCIGEIAAHKRDGFVITAAINEHAELTMLGRQQSFGVALGSRATARLFCLVGHVKNERGRTFMVSVLGFVKQRGGCC